MSELKDKVPPNNLEAEQSTLGALLLNWEAAGDIAAKLRADQFYYPRHQLIYQAILTLLEEGIPGDLITLVDKLTTNGTLEQAGGISYLSSLTQIVPSAANIENYAKIVIDLATRRELISLSSEIRKDSYDESHSSREILEDVEKRIFALNDTNTTSQISGVSEIIPKAIQLIEARWRNKGALSGIGSGLQDLDAMTSGFHDSEMIIVGARPSMGKTALALSMMESIAIDQRIPCGFFSLEMSKDQIVQRLLSQVAKVSGTNLRDGRVTKQDLFKLQDAAATCFEAPLYIVDTPNMKLLDLRAMARRMVTKHGVKIIFIDYIGLITNENQNLQEYDKVSQISKSLKSLARELNIPLVVLCQVSRNAEGEEPNLSQLRGSGSIEQDADMVMFIHGVRANKIKEDNTDPNFVPGIFDRKIIVAKQRNGPVGEVDVLFLSNYTKFVNKTKDDN